MNAKKLGLIGFLVLLGAVVIFNRKKVELTHQNSFELQPIANTGFELHSVIHLNNPNLLSVTVDRIHERFYVNRVQIGELDNELKQGIPGMKETEFPVSIRFTKDELERASNGVTNIKNIEIVVDGEIDYNNFTGSNKIEVHQPAEWKK